MATNKKEGEPKNYLIQQETPDKLTEEFYDFDKLVKLEYGEVWGAETHLRRRKLMMKAHPQIAQYLTPSKPYSIILSVLLVTLALITIYFLKDSNWPAFLFLGYWVGGTINHSLHIMIHELTHFNGHKNMDVNKFMAMFCNIPSGIPSAMSFGKHHADHHNFMGEEKKDPDLPLRIESQASKNPLFKIVFWVFLTVFYAVRPIFFSTHATFTRAEFTNLYFIMTTNLLILYFWGINAWIFMLYITLVSMGPHPAAAHTIAEHYEMVKGIETYDYFGFWNFLNFNLGYHTEHHDFPTCPWYNLPKIREAAPEFYEHLPYHTSYTKLILKFLFDKNFNLFNRTIRVPEKKTE